MYSRKMFSREVVFLLLANWLIIAPCLLLGIAILRMLYPEIYSTSIYPILLFVIGLFLIIVGVKGATLKLRFAIQNNAKFISWNSIGELLYIAVSSFGLGVVNSALVAGIHLFFQNN